ncbi:MAG: oligosaccharide flippase family protein [Acutalibacteraceae bacterium]|nr:oligosaccharide flippase family protein [Acutalibacteraceae bacterium]
MAKNEVKWGALLSYLLVIVNALYGFLIIPYILSSLGDAEYGVYKTISSLSSALMILDLGLGGTAMRYIAKFKSEEKKDKIESFVSMALGEGLIICLGLMVISAVIYTLIPAIYAEGLSQNEIELAKKLFIFLALNMVFHIIENVFNGVISGFNKFTVSNGIKLGRILFRVALLFVVFIFVKNAVALVLIDLFLTVVQIIVEFIYIKTKLKTKIKLSFKNWDKELFKESFKYTMLLFITTIASQINNNLDNVVIGAIRGSALVAVYSMGLLIFGMFEQLSTSLSGVMLPTVTNVLKNDSNGSQIKNTIINIGRIQFMLLGAALVGFVVLGKQAIYLWLGEGYEDVYVITLILMAPALLELCVNVCLAVLRAKNMLGFRTAVLFGTTVLNAIITIIGVKHVGYYAAAIGTAVSFLIGSVVIMNIYYWKKLSFNMFKIYQNIFSRTWICLLISGGAIVLSSRFLHQGLMAFVLNIVIFCAVYGITMILFGFKKEEKNKIPVLNKLFK